MYVCIYLYVIANVCIYAIYMNIFIVLSIRRPRKQRYPSSEVYTQNPDLGLLHHFPTKKNHSTQKVDATAGTE